MDGIHDLGGKQGYGKIDVNEPEEPFHARYDGVGWTINQTTRAPGMSIDWWRHIRELTPPVDYLTRPYFDQWVMTQVIAMIDTGQLSLDEVLTGEVESLDQPAKTMNIDDVHQATKNSGVRFDRKIDQAAEFSIGDKITTRSYSISGHTRLPAYAQGKTGFIHEHHGAHMFPDACAQGEERAEHLYSVKFKSIELWPEDKEKNNWVYLDLWESYFVNQQI